MALQRTRRPRIRSGRSLRSLGSPLNARSLDAGRELRRASGLVGSGRGIRGALLGAPLPDRRLPRRAGCLGNRSFSGVRTVRVRQLETFSFEVARVARRGA